MGNKHLKNENLSPKNGKYNQKSRWLAGMFHVFDFHHWRTKNSPICWKTPRTHSLIRETDEHEPFLDSIDEDSKMISVVEDDNSTRLKKMMTTKQVTEYVDFLEILRQEDVCVKILKDSNSELRNQIQIKSNPRILPKSGSFPLSGSSRPAKIEHKQRENWYGPKQNGAVLTLIVPKDKPIFPSNAVINGFREIKKLIKNVLKDRKNTEKINKKLLDVSTDDYVERYSQLLDQSFSRKVGQLRSRSLKLSYEEKSSDSRVNKPQFFRRVLSLSNLEVLGSFLTDMPRDSSTKKPVDQYTNFGSKKPLLLSESLVRTEKEEEQEQRSQDNITNHRILQQDQDSVLEKKTETLPSKGLGLSSSEIHNHEEEVEDAYFCYVKNVLKVSGFLENKDNVEKWHSEDQPLNPSLLYELEIQEEVVNKELLFDLVNESIVEIRNQSHIYFPKTLAFVYPNEKHFLDEVWRRVKWSLYGLGTENRDRSLDDIVVRDLTKCDGWMNTRSESEWLTLELEDLIFDEVLNQLLCVYSEIQTSFEYFR